MHLLLIAATAAEIQPSIDWLSKNGSSNLSFSSEALITGVTAATTTYWLTKVIHSNRPSLIIQAGIAGSFAHGKNGNVVAVSEDTFADCGVWENDQFKTVFDLGLVDKNKFPFTGGFLTNPYKALITLSALEAVRAITVNEISAQSKTIDWYKQTLTPAIESMEGAALHYVCLLEKIPFLQIRSISNMIGERDKSQWKMNEAIAALNDQLISLFEKLSDYDEVYFRI
jgi:futalosine hydrolase